MDQKPTSKKSGFEQYFEDHGWKSEKLPFNPSGMGINGMFMSAEWYRRRREQQRKNQQ